MGELGFCHYSDIFQAVKGGLISDISADGGLPVMLVRFLHNKAVYGFVNSLRCYLTYFDFLQIFRFISPFLLPFILFALGGRKWRKTIIILVATFPLIFIFLLKEPEIGTKIYIFQGFYILLAIFGCLKAILAVKGRL